jgi:hypothetical protein
MRRDMSERPSSLPHAATYQALRTNRPSSRLLIVATLAGARDNALPPACAAAAISLSKNIGYVEDWR